MTADLEKLIALRGFRQRRGQRYTKRTVEVDREWAIGYLRSRTVTDASTGCWLWTRSMDHGGYGRVELAGEVRAHRAAWVLEYGEIPAGACVLHHCDMPACCNPEHLHLGTHADNAQDKVSRGRHLAGSRNPRHKLTEEDVRAIREAHASGVARYNLAARYGVAHSTICQVIDRKHWRHVA